MHEKAATGAADDTLLLKGDPTAQVPTDWSRDGRYIAFTKMPTARELGSTDVWVLPLFGDRKPIPIANTAFQEDSAVFSPDGRWIAYSSNESGQTQVHVQPFPATGEKYQVSKINGAQPMWRGDGKELFFIATNSTIMAAPVNATAHFESGLPQPLFVSGATSSSRRQYAVTRDGRRFLVNRVEQQTSATPLTVVVNWLSAVQK
jgi:dipeptidyl aminopeptidase/acylaminoacyl peptidase